MRIITVSREFGSGGRELGKRLADELGISYYDREIISAIAKDTDLHEAYVATTLENGLFSYSATIGTSFTASSLIAQNTVDILVAQQRIMKELAEKGDCVIVGRSADVILEKYEPFNLFVYSDMESKIKRCRERADGEDMSDKVLLKKIKKIDKNRAKLHSMVSNVRWGERGAYHMMVNTTGITVKEIVKPVAEYAKHWFEKHGK